MRHALLALAALAAAPAAWAQPVETPKRTKFVDIVGDEACPRSSDPSEIVVCRRQDPESLFRLPPTIRNEQRQARDNVREQRAMLTDPNIGGAGACSPTGVAGQSGCTGGLDVLAAGRRAVNAVRGEDTIPDKPPQ